jgi:anti-anti-sigma regulatory factor
VVDVNAVVSCSPAAVETLEAAGRRFTEAGGSFRLRRPSAMFQRLLHTYGMAGRFAVETPSDAGTTDE